MKEYIAKGRQRMDGAIEAFQRELASVRTGRASVSLLDRVHVNAYGSSMPLNQVATVTAPEARLLLIQPYDRSMIGAIEKGIMESDIGMSPSNDGQVIRIAVPPLTEERRKEFVKLAHKMAEEGRVAVRNVRRDVLNEAKRAEKEGELSKNELGRLQDEVQKITDEHVKKIDEILGRKEAEIMEV